MYGAEYSTEYVLWYGMQLTYLPSALVPFI